MPDELAQTPASEVATGIGGALDKPLAVTFFKDAAARTKREELYSLRSLATRIKAITAARKTGLPWLKLARFGQLRTDKESLRHDANVIAISGIEADYDGGAVTVDEACELLTKQDLAAVVYTSPSHTEDAPRWRILCPLSEEMPPDRREKMLGRLNGLFRGIFSGESFTLSQAYYYGSVKANPSHRVELIEGMPIDLHNDLDEGWIGKPQTTPKSNGSASPRSGPLNVEAVLRELGAGTNYHQAAIRLAGHYATAGKPFIETRKILRDAMESVLPPDRDQRWHSRYADLDRTLEYVFGKQAAKEAPLGVLGRHCKYGGMENDGEQRQVDGDEPRAGSYADPITAPSFFDPWADPPPAEFPRAVLSSETEDTVLACAERDGVCPGALAMAYLAGASGASPKGSRFKPYQHSNWSVPPIVWVMTIADSGQRKTAIEDLAFVALREAHAELWRAHRNRMHAWQALPAKVRKETTKPEEPHSFVVEDVTPEKLQMILAATDRGTFMVRDEMAGLLEFGRYAGNSGAAERAFYLQAYEGGHYTVSRVSRDSLHITVNGLTIYGSIQPDRLKDFPDLAKDGLLQRINMVRASPATASQDDVVVGGVDRISSVILGLTRREAQRYQTTADGSDIIRQTERDGREFASIADYGQGFQGTCSKLHGTHARYALVLHLLDNPDQEVIPTATVERAGTLIREFLLPQARGFFGSLTGAPHQRLREAAGWILTKAPPRFLASDVMAGVRACRGMGTKELGELLDPLAAGGWIEPETPFPSNRAWEVHPKLREAFAERAVAEQTRREEVRRLFGQIARRRS
jgi:hypothetical protein